MGNIRDRAEELDTSDGLRRDRDLGACQLSNDCLDLLRGIDIPIVTVGTDLRILHFTGAAVKVLNLAAHHLGGLIAAGIPNFELAHVQDLILEVIESGIAVEREIQDRSGRWYSLRIWPYRRVQDRTDGAIIAFVDIDNLKSALERVVESRNHTQAVLETVREPLVILDCELRVVKANRSFQITFRIDSDQIGERLFFDLENGEWNIQKLRWLLEGVRTGNECIHNFELDHHFSRIGHRIFLINARRVSGPGSHSQSILLSIEDITERKRVEMRLTHDALHDALTDLPNRTLLQDRLERAIARAKRLEGHSYALLFLDLDRFKIVNDSFGHEIGDQVLIEVARRLQQCVRMGDTVARFGGDEFVILLDGIKEAKDASDFANRIQKEINSPLRLGRHTLSISASIGIAISAHGYHKAEHLLYNVDTAMYRAKSLGRAKHVMVDLVHKGLNTPANGERVRHAAASSEASGDSP